VMRRFVRLFVFIFVLVFSWSVRPAGAVVISDLDGLEDYFNCRGQINCKFLKRGIKRDSVDCIEDPDLVFEFDRHLKKDDFNIEGKIRYLGLVAKKYRYNVRALDDGSYVVSSKFFIKNRVSQDSRDLLQARLNEAAQIWESFSPFPFSVYFEFQLVEEKKDADFSINVKAGKSRGPYDTNWSLLWGARSFAHEMGHVLGLDDEYKNRPGGGSTKNCSKESMMCNHYLKQAKFLKYHYYMIFRRLYCA